MAEIQIRIVVTARKNDPEDHLRDLVRDQGDDRISDTRGTDRGLAVGGDPIHMIDTGDGQQRKADPGVRRHTENTIVDGRDHIQTGDLGVHHHQIVATVVAAAPTQEPCAVSIARDPDHDGDDLRAPPAPGRGHIVLEGREADLREDIDLEKIAAYDRGRGNNIPPAGTQPRGLYAEFHGPDPRRCEIVGLGPGSAPLVHEPNPDLGNAVGDPDQTREGDAIPHLPPRLRLQRGTADRNLGHRLNSRPNHRRQRSH